MPKQKARNPAEELIAAIGDHKAEVVQKLLAAGADANAKLNDKNHGDLSVLGYAAACQFVEGVESLLRAGADVNYCSSGHPGGSGRTALYEAVMGEDARSKPLNPSTEEDRIRLVEILLAAGANPNEVGKGDRLPLSAAAGLARYEICEKLIEAGANFRTWPGNCDSPLMAAAGAKSFNSAVRDARQEQIVTLLLESGAPVDGGHDGYTPLMAAALSGRENFVELLLKQKASVNLQEPQYGRTPMICAALFYRWDGYNEVKQQLGLRIIKRLLEAGADPTVRNNKGENACDVVARCNNPAAANLIKEHLPK